MKIIDYENNLTVIHPARQAICGWVLAISNMFHDVCYCKHSSSWHDKLTHQKLGVIRVVNKKKNLASKR